MDNNNDVKQKSLVKFIENIWYHYKFAIIAVIAVAVLATICTMQMLSKKEPDVFIYHISSSGITAKASEEMRESLSVFAEDYNDDGTVTVDLKEEVFVQDLEAAAKGQMSVTESFTLELSCGECVIYMMDESFYRGNSEYMADLEDVLGYLPEAAYDEKSLLLSELPAYKNTPGICDFPANTFICFVKQRGGMNKLDDDIYSSHKRFFRKFVEYLIYEA